MSDPTINMYKLLDMVSANSELLENIKRDFISTMKSTADNITLLSEGLMSLNARIMLIEKRITKLEVKLK